MRLKRVVWLALIFAVLVSAAGLYARGFVERELTRPLFAGDTAQILDVANGSSMYSVAAMLGERGWLKHPRLWVWYGRYTQQADAIKAGEYEVAAGTSAVGLLNQLVAGKVLLHSITFVEGWTFAQVRAALAADPNLTQDAAELSDAELLERIGSDATHPEGWFFPDTYRFARGTSDLAILVNAHARMREQLEAVWAERQDDLPLENAYEALILASIVEKETALDTERQEIAGVFTRRLRKGMRLQTDPTVIYGLGPEFDGDLRRADLRRDTPYNTYTRAGLTPTPIALPGAASLRAAVTPAAGDALYFVASGEADGSHVFTATLEAHNAAVQRYLRRLRERR